MYEPDPPLKLVLNSSYCPESTSGVLLADIDGIDMLEEIDALTELVDDIMNGLDVPVSVTVTIVLTNELVTHNEFVSSENVDVLWSEFENMVFLSAL